MASSLRLKTVSGRFTVLCFACVFGLFSLLDAGGVRDELEDLYQRRVEYAFREWLRGVEPLHPSLKILVYDDKTVDLLRRHDFTALEWTTFLRLVAAREPKAIFIDKLFALPIGTDYKKGFTKEEREQFVEAMAGLGVPVYVGSAIDSNIASRPWVTPLPLDSAAYDLGRMTGTDDAATRERLTKWIKQKPGALVGPDPSIHAAFGGIGQLEHAGYGTIWPLIGIGADKAIPHASLLTLGPIGVANKAVLMDGMAVPVDHRGRLHVDLGSFERFTERIYSIRDVLVAAYQKRPLTYIEPGDYVAILPMFYTGNTDFKDTPIGRVPGAVYPVMTMNSRLTGGFIVPFRHGQLAILTACVIGLVIGLMLKGIGFWIALLVYDAILPAAGLLAFTHLKVSIPWGAGMAAGTAMGLALFAMRSVLTERQSRSLRTALEGTFPPDRLTEILKNPEALKRKPSEQNLTIMFIDIVGFSLVSETQEPEEAFLHLKRHMRAISETIHKYGGIIDKTLGDGLLCFFGYDYTGKNQGDQRHADMALACAIEIQRQALARNMAAHRQGEHVFPLRIGINTADVYIGDVGDSKRIDFTVIGHGVNLAARLEPACAPFLIMIGTGTRQAIDTDAHPGTAIHTRRIQIKHYEELFEAYEVNPFVEREEELRALLRKYARSRGLQRDERRFPVKAPGDLVLETAVGHADLLEMSDGGFSAVLDTYLAPGVTLNAKLKAREPELDEMLEGLHLMPFAIEVKWGRPVDGGYAHGFAIKSLNREQRQLLFTVCAGALRAYLDYEQAS